MKHIQSRPKPKKAIGLKLVKHKIRKTMTASRNWKLPIAGNLAKTKLELTPRKNAKRHMPELDNVSLTIRACAPNLKLITTQHLLMCLIQFWVRAYVTPCKLALGLRQNLQST